MSIVWVDDAPPGVAGTPLDAAHMNQLEQITRKAQANGYASLGADGKVPAAQLPAAPAPPDLSPYQLRSEEQQANGYLGLDGARNANVPGGSLSLGAGDASIYRRAGNVVGTIGSFAADGAAGGWGFVTYATGKAQPTAMLRNDAILYFGSGDAAVDTYLYRASGLNLRTNGSFWADNSVIVDASNGGGRLYLGGALDSYLWRGWAAGILTNSEFRVSSPSEGYGAFGTQSPTGMWWAMNTAGVMSWGPGNSTFDLRLYRSSAGRMIVDSNGVTVTDFRIAGSNLPRWSLYNTAAPPDKKKWQFFSDNTTGDLSFGPLSDSEAIHVANPFVMGRNGNFTTYTLTVTSPSDGYLPDRLKAAQVYTRDLNNVVENGWFGFDPNTPNRPAAVWGYGISIGLGGNTNQRQYAWNYSVTSVGSQGWWRSRNDGNAWGAWEAMEIVDGKAPGRLQAVAMRAPSGDANQCLNNGWYYTDSGVVNLPVADYGALEVMNISYTGACRQIWHQHATYNSWHRFQNGPGSWSAWIRLNPSNNRFAAGGSTVVTTDGNAEAWIDTTSYYSGTPYTVVATNGDPGSGTIIYSTKDLGATGFRVKVFAVGPGAMPNFTCRVNWIVIWS